MHDDIFECTLYASADEVTVMTHGVSHYSSHYSTKKADKKKNNTNLIKSLFAKTDN